MKKIGHILWRFIAVTFLFMSIDWLLTDKEKKKQA
ncbi:hypothetical protein IGI39_003646 [Enterococcus sp. AZ135]